MEPIGEAVQAAAQANTTNDIFIFADGDEISEWAKEGGMRVRVVLTVRRFF